MSFVEQRFVAARPISLPGGIVPRNGKLHFIQLLRSLAIVLVVACHCQDPFDSADPVRSAYVNLLTRHVNIFFILVSGFLFQYLIDRYSYGEYLKSKLLNVVTPYAVASIPAIFAFLSGLKSTEELGFPAGAHGPLEIIVFVLLTGKALAPFWFVPMVCILFLLSPVWKRIDERPELYWLIVPMLCVSAIAGRSFGDSNPLSSTLRSILPEWP
jgi:probable poly-beta-1,6-N-acetyl-D-glucosamine export protein